MEPSACVYILSLLKRIVPVNIQNIMVVRGSSLSCAVFVVVVVVVVVINTSSVG